MALSRYNVEIYQDPFMLEARGAMSCLFQQVMGHALPPSTWILIFKYLRDLKDKGEEVQETSK